MEECASFRALVFSYFSDIDSKGRIDIIIKSLGWATFRNRLAALYIHYQAHGEFPATVDTTLAKGLEEFEAKLINHTVDGFSRSYLLAFYLKMARLWSMNKDCEDLLEHLNVEEEIFKYLRSAKAKTVKIDWLILLLCHFHYVFGGDELKKVMDEGTNYTEIFQSLSEAQQDMLMQNFYSYGYSINEVEIFYVETV